MEFIIGSRKAIAPSGCVTSSFAYDFAVLFVIDKPVFGSFEHGDLVAFQSATTAKDQFPAVYRVLFESVNHFL